jgi:hypothetical protein
VVFCSTTFGAVVVATQRPITCPKRQLPKYVKRNKIQKYFLKNIGFYIDKRNKLDLNIIHGEKNGL